MSTSTSRRKTIAYVLPFGLFMLGLAVLELISVFHWRPEYPLTLSHFVFPVQTVVCAVALVWYWREYEFGSFLYWWAGFAMGFLVLAIWVSPQWVMGFEERIDGFDPNAFEEGSALYWGNLSVRFLRLVVVVPLLEEIFWRGFLMRYVIDDRWRTVPFGKFTPMSFATVAVLFALAHWGPDFIPALITGVLYNALAVWTRSLGVCVIAHAVTNLGLGIYIMVTEQWGFW